MSSPLRNPEILNDNELDQLIKLYHLKLDRKYGYNVPSLTQQTSQSGEFALFYDILQRIPVENLNEMTELENKLRSDPLYKKALIILFENRITGEIKISKCIYKIMSSIMKPDLTKSYSGLGKKHRNNVRKRDFSATQCYRCLESALVKKFDDSEQVSKIKSLVGIWLSRTPQEKTRSRSKNYNKRKYVRKSTLNNRQVGNSL
ncbi:uncharacterized protein [Chelonus insularis]|uniref:uncharacterized protein n=1 Tax=Chelonus insularis TaxID=460826 RepID=UPI00158C5741|nr:uncharacterized protein LOC118069351 [Chelonus insularis]